MSEIVCGAAPCLCVEKVKATEDYKLHLLFSDGNEGVFDFKPLLKKPIYEELNNLALFMTAATDGCGVIWNDDIDIAPTYLYEHCIPENRHKMIALIAANMPEPNHEEV